MCLVATAAIAQEGSAPLEEIVVTAQKRDQSANDVGMSISAVSGDALAKRGIESAEDLVRVVPGFSYSQTQFDMPVYTLRGVGYYESSLSANPAVSVYVDEVPLPYPGMTRGAMLDLQRVEVLAGPQGTLFGQNSTGGAINYIAKRPTEAFDAGLTASYARFDTVGLDAHVSGPLAESLKGRVAVGLQNGDGWQRSQTRDESLGATDEVVARALLDWDPADTVSVRLNLNGWRDRSDSQAPQNRGVFAAVPTVPLDPAFVAAPLAPDDPRAADFDAGVDYGRDSSFYQGALRIDWKMSDAVSLTSISAFQRLDREQLAETDGTPVQDLTLGTTGHINSYSQELRLAGSAGRLQHWVVGASYQDDDILDKQAVLLDRSTSAVVDLGPLGSFHFANFDNLSSNAVRSWALFASTEWTLTDRLGLELGARYTDSRNRFTGCSADSGNGELAAAFGALQALGAFLGATPTTTTSPGGCVTIVDGNFNVGETSATLHEDNVSWRAGLNWKASDSTLIYGNVSRGFKAGNFPTLSASSAAQFTPAVQERLTAYEAGFKASLAAGYAQLNGAAFYYDYIDKQLRGRVTDPIFGQLEALVNVPKSHVQGAELQGLWRITRDLTGSLGLAYIDTRIDGRFENFSQFGGPPQSFSGNAFPYSPKWQATTDLEYTHPIGASLTGFIGGALTYRDATKGGLEDDPRLAIDSYALLDLRIGVESDNGRWRVMVFGRNITDKYYWNNVLKAQDNVIRYAGRPASYGIIFTLQL